MLSAAVVLALLLGAEHPGVRTPDWVAVQSAARSYKAIPSDDNARRLCQLIPDRELDVSERPPEDAVSTLYGLVQLLEAQMFLGDSSAVRVAFRLRRVADAAFAEDLDVALGALATNRPELFLRELNRAKASCECVAQFSTDITEQEVERERRLRLARLRESVPRELEASKEKCIKMLIDSQ